MGKQKRDRRAERAARNKKSFDDVIGDPFSKPEPIEGHYTMLKSRSSLAIAEPERKAASPQNPARPNAVDFFCDVEAAVRDGLEIFSRTWREELRQCEFIFETTYFTEDQHYYQFTQKERAELEQIIGNILVARSISPVSKYFTTIRQ